MNTKRKFMTALAVAGVVGGLSYTAQALDTDLDAQFTARTALSATVDQVMDFGTIEVTVGAHNGLIQMGTDGNVALGGGPAGLTASGSPAAGQLTITGDGATTVDISCETGGVLDEASNTVEITLQNTEITVDAAGQAFGAATGCTGLGNNIATSDLSAGDNDADILVGGELNIGAQAMDAVPDATYTTTVNDGDPVTVRVLYQ